MTTIALTGSTGFIGRGMARGLRERGFRVRLLLRRPPPVPIEADSAIIGELAQPQNLSAAFRDVDVVVHAAGVGPTTGLPEADFRRLNAEGTVALATAAHRAGVRRFIFLSSVRAQVGASATEIVRDDAAPEPTDPYGRSKLAAEDGLAGVGIDWAALRSVGVYGPGGRGNMARMLAIGMSRYPLPFAGLKSRRSLLAIGNLVDAVETLAKAPGEIRRAMLVADDGALTIAEMFAAIRIGMGRRPLLWPLPAPLLNPAIRYAQLTNVVGRSLVVETPVLRALGWEPRIPTRDGLMELARAPNLATVA